MKIYLVSLVLTLAAAASLVVLVKALTGSGEERALRELGGRMEELSRSVRNLEQGLAEIRREPGGDGAESAGPEDLARWRRDVMELLTEVEQLTFDLERNLRKDLKQIYEQLLGHLERIHRSLQPEIPPEERRRQLEEQLKAQGVELDREAGRLAFQAVMTRPEKPLELLITGEGGRTHETLLVCDVPGSLLRRALEELGLTEVPDPEPATLEWPEDADSVVIYLSWEGLEHPRRVEDCIWNAQAEATLERTPWMFTASAWATDLETWERYFVADVYENLVAITWNRLSESVLACPLKATIRENIWFPAEGACPEAGTKVRVVMSQQAVEAWDG